jgi:hypothetical protein
MPLAGQFLVNAPGAATYSVMSGKDANALRFDQKANAAGGDRRSGTAAWM